MLNFIGRLHQRIVGRMLLYVIVPTALVLALIIFWNVRRNFTNLRALSEERLDAQAAFAALEIEDENNNAVLSAQRMAEAQVAGLFGNRQASIDYARSVLENLPGITAAYFGYEPNADQQDAQSKDTIPPEAMDESGRFIPYWRQVVSKGNAIELEPLVDMDSSLYYQGAKEEFHRTGKATPMITEPYVYQGKMIVEQTYPIVVDGAFVGVAGIDRALADVERRLRDIAKAEGVDLFLISSRGKFIASTTDSIRESSFDTQGLLKTRPVADTLYRDLLGEMVNDNRKSMHELAVDPTDGRRYYFIAARIPTGGWLLVLRQSEDDILAPIWGQLRAGIAVAVAGLLFVMGLLLVMTLNLSRRVNIAAEAAERVARGDLTQTVDPGNCKDETGGLLRSIKNMTGNLNELVGHVKQASIQLNSTATQLAATSHQQEATASSFGASSHEIAAASKQISATSTELVQTMDDVRKVAEGTAQVATAGRASLRDMETNMRGLDEATVSIAEKLAVINEKASHITGIVTTITKVADQTNLLSVNAAIEAEKAGEYGVGFLVVAREIRRLADQTAAATLDIEQMVQQMQAAVSAGVMEMDRFTDQVRRSVKDVGEISQQMEQIIERVNTNTASFGRVNESMQSQSQGAAQISDAMAQLTADAKQTRDSLGEYSRAATDLQEAITSLKASIASFQLST